MTPSQRIDRLIAELTDWRGKTFASVRKSVLETDREIIEEWKWMGSPVWSRDGLRLLEQKQRSSSDAVDLVHDIRSRRHDGADVAPLLAWAHRRAVAADQAARPGCR